MVQSEQRESELIKGSGLSESSPLSCSGSMRDFWGGGGELVLLSSPEEDYFFLSPSGSEANLTSLRDLKGEDSRYWSAAIFQWSKGALVGWE